MATVPFDNPETITDLDDIVDPTETISDSDLLIPSGLKGEAPQYTSLARKVSIEKRAVKPGGKYAGKPFLSVTLEFDQLEDQDGNVIKLSRPLRGFVQTLRWPNGPGKVGVRPSNADKYLEACGMGYEGLSGQELYDALMESATNPVVVHIGWQSIEKDEATGETTYGRLRTGDFKDEAGQFQETVTDEAGNEVKAFNTVTYFSRV